MRVWGWLLSKGHYICLANTLNNRQSIRMPVGFSDGGGLGKCSMLPLLLDKGALRIINRRNITNFMCKFVVPMYVCMYVSPCVCSNMLSTCSLCMLVWQARPFSLSSCGGLIGRLARRIYQLCWNRRYWLCLSIRNDHLYIFWTMFHFRN